MIDKMKTEEQLITELIELRRRNAELEKAEALYRLTEKDLKESITELKKNLAVLAETEERYRLLTENTDSLICEVSAESIFLFVNSAFKEVLGYEKHELIGRTIVEIIHPDEVERAINEYTKLLQNRLPSKHKWRMHHRNGAWVWFECIGNIFDTNTGEPRFVIVSTNITEQKQLEKELNDNKHFIERILDTTPNLLYIYDLVRHRIIFNNQEVERFLGGTTQAMVSKAFFLNLLHPGDHLHVIEHYNRLKGADSGEVTEIECRIKRADGEWRWLLSREVIFARDSNGVAIEVLGTAEDITERKQVEEALHEQLRFLQVVINTIPSPVFYKNAEGIYLGCNKAFEKFLGLPKNQIIGKTVYDLFPRNLADKYYERDLELYSQSKAQIYEHVAVNGQGEVRNVIFTKAKFKKIDDTLGGMVVGINDITEYKQNEENLRLANQLQQIIEFLPDATYVLDQNKSVIAWNRAIEILTGINKQELIGKSDREYAIPFFGEKRAMLIDYIWDKKPIRNEYKSVIRENDTIYAQISVNSLPHGKERLLEVKASPLKNNQDLIIGAIETIRDITRQQEMEEESLKAQKIESIGVLAGGIAHDFNNLLTSILANIQLTKMKFEKGKDIADSLVTIEDTIKQAANLTRQLLTFSKGGAPMKKATCLNDILKDSAEFVLRGSKSRCRISIPDESWMIDADSGQISQVIGNLVINADQAMPTGGTIKITAENKVIKNGNPLPVVPGKYLKISISDTGVGIPKESIHKIFDPYYTTKKHGNGLGLATSYFIISRHNGHISVESTVGAGTVFHIYLPALDCKPPSRLTTEAILTGGYGKILFMDDEVMICEAAGEMLREIGYEVEYSQEGTEAIDLYLKAKNAGKPFDVIITDLTIPGGLGGKETVQKLKEIDRNVKAIVSSGYSNDPVMSNYMDYGFSGVVAKPFKIEELNEVLKNVLEKQALGIGR